MRQFVEAQNRLSAIGRLLTFCALAGMVGVLAAQAFAPALNNTVVPSWLVACGVWSVSALLGPARAWWFYRPRAVLTIDEAGVHWTAAGGRPMTVELRRVEAVVGRRLGMCILTTDQSLIPLPSYLKRVQDLARVCEYTFGMALALSQPERFVVLPAPLGPPWRVGVRAADQAPSTIEPLAARSVNLYQSSAAVALAIFLTAVVGLVIRG